VNLRHKRKANRCAGIFMRILPESVEIVRKTTPVLAQRQVSEISLPTIHKNRMRTKFSKATISTRVTIGEERGESIKKKFSSNACNKNEKAACNFLQTAPGVSGFWT
jgi:hypothetical protein